MFWISYDYYVTMDLRSALAGISDYSHLASKSQRSQQLLEQIRKEAPPELPVGYEVLVSGRGISLPIVPWIALLDPDVTETAQDGLYLVYLFSPNDKVVYLSMNQGATQHLNAAHGAGLTGSAAEQSALNTIAKETELIRRAIGTSLLANTLEDIELPSGHFLPDAYQNGNIAALRYSLGALPDNAQLVRDLEKFTLLYKSCVQMKDSLTANGFISTSARSKKHRKPELALSPLFKPKDSTEYLIHISESTQRRTRLHEKLVELFGEAVRTPNRTPATNVHPRDLVIYENDLEWLIEAKTVGPNAELAVRQAIGQLFSYRHFYYRTQGKSDPYLLALFNAPIGGAFEQLLESLNIEFVYRSGSQWFGSRLGLSLLST